MALNKCALVSTNPTFTLATPDTILVNATLACTVLARLSVAVGGTLTVILLPLVVVTTDLTAEILLNV